MKKILIVFLLSIFSTCSKSWNYEGSSSPAHWGDLDEKFKFCKIGYNQSPIDIKFEFKDSELKFTYVESEIAKEREKFTLKTNFYGENFLFRGKKQYLLRNMRFHHPSEHLIDGKPYSLEMQITHKSNDEQLLNLAIFLEVGKENPEFEKLIQFFVSKKKDGKFNLADIVKEDDKVFFYDGSITTPPCTEGVKWYVMKTPILISKEQMNRLIKSVIFVKSNARPVQEFRVERY